MYNFGFTADTGPTSSQARIGLFAPNFPPTLVVPDALQAALRSPLPAPVLWASVQLLWPGQPQFVGRDRLDRLRRQPGRVRHQRDPGRDGACRWTRSAYFLMGSGSNTFTRPARTACSASAGRASAACSHRSRTRATPAPASASSSCASISTPWASSPARRPTSRPGCGTTTPGPDIEPHRRGERDFLPIACHRPSRVSSLDPSNDRSHGQDNLHAPLRARALRTEPRTAQHDRLQDRGDGNQVRVLG